jgi:lysophospholipase L1-like esterase
MIGPTRDSIEYNYCIRASVKVERRLDSMVSLTRSGLKTALGLIVSLGLVLPSIPTRAADFEKWEKEIAAYEQADRTSPPAKGGLLFIGSSTIRLWKTLAQDFPQHRVLNRGFGGSQIVDSTHFAERIIFPYVPRMILLRAGGNDIHAGKSPELVFSDFRAFVAKLQERLPDTQIAYIALSPSIARWDEKEKGAALNRMVREYCGQITGVKYIASDSVSLGPDGKPRPELFVNDKLHFSPAGYKLLAESVRPHLPK